MKIFFENKKKRKIQHYYKRFRFYTLFLYGNEKKCVFFVVSTWILARFQGEEGVLGSRKYFSRKATVLREFLELREPPIHFSNASGRFLTISDEFPGDYRPLVGDYER